MKRIPVVNLIYSEYMTNIPGGGLMVLHSKQVSCELLKCGMITVCSFEKG